MNRATAHVDLGAIRHNIQTLEALAPQSQFMLAVKSNAYGHGLHEVVRTALDAGVTSFGVLESTAGLELRSSGVDVPLFAWMHGRDTDFAAAAEARIDLGVQTFWQLEAIAASGAGVVPRVHLKIDTGLHRGGADQPRWTEFVTEALRLQALGKVEVVAAWSHLSDTSHSADLESTALFRSAVEEARSLGAQFELLHLGASAAVIDLPEAHFDLVRVGIAAYGISPFGDRSAADLGLRPAMQLRAPVLDARHGLASIAVGFGDGIQSDPDGGAFVLVDGHVAPVVEVGVDETVVALPSGAGQVAAGSECIVFGDGTHGEATAEQWAVWGETVGDEIVTGLTKRVLRDFAAA
ncbi:alanine racemase [Pseudoclavibacter sp. AY1F1]|uniref:alanine racemase n=1 Tax=Pseudoclavibacter sp. AY1F1 TaxID=2080583 RepID=UPI000CE81920|nr:alanine racemase [Pseudoclavibacter sp. AY1F1]PPF47277.1 alanine racemase [Pseudoclavibacter sp. AY1F1]